jgi:hypothetical protein
MENIHETPLSTKPKAPLVPDHRELTDESQESTKDLAPSSTLQERLENWGSD